MHSSSLLVSEQEELLSPHLYCLNVYQKLLLEAKRRLGEILSAFEFLDNESLDLVRFLMVV
jgi:hypothetical protein